MEEMMNQFKGKDLLTTDFFRQWYVKIGLILGTILTFTAIYYMMKNSQQDNVSDENKLFKGLDKDSTLLDAFYFAFTTTSTVGYGDIHARTEYAKLAVLLQQAIVVCISLL